MTFSCSCEPYAIIRGNAIEVLKQLQLKVDCVMTSPAYYQQRIYGTGANESGRELSVAGCISDLVDVFREIPPEPWASILSGISLRGWQISFYCVFPGKVSLPTAPA